MKAEISKIFQFFNYKTDKELGSLLASINDSGAVAVFDLEDSKYVPFNPLATERLKESSRGIILDKLKGVFPENPLSAIRINNPSTGDYKKDIELLEKLKDHHEFRYLFLPKTESVLSIKQLIQDVEKAGLRLPGIIPIIETKKGTGNLEGIAEFCRLNGVKSVAFGHSDYNLDIGIFPFIHPGSPEFIELIKPFVEKIENEGLEYVNTPFLCLSDIPLFKRVLADVANTCRYGFSQVTLSKLQTVSLKRLRSDMEPSPRMISENTLSETEKISLAESLISEYETLINGNTGIVINDKGRVLTPQEYECAKKLLGSGKIVNNQGDKKFTMCIFGGCLPVQEKIETEELYHEILKKRAIEKYGLNTEIIYERYDSLGAVPDILENTFSVNRPDCLIFHVRPDPFLLNIKIFVKYFSRENTIKRKLNFHLAGFNEYRPFPVNAGRSRTEKQLRKYSKQSLRFVNYSAGILCGNYLSVSDEYIKLINELKRFCASNNIELVVTGPPARPRSMMEMFLLKKFGKKMKKKFSGNTRYVDFFRFRDEEGSSLFMDDMIHYNKKGHQLFAELLAGHFLEIAGRNDRNHL